MECAFPRFRVLVFVLVGLLGCRQGPPDNLVIISLDEDAHQSVCKRMADDQPAATMVAEQGVVMAVLRDEADLRFQHTFTEDDYDVGEFSTREEAFVSTLLNEALKLLRSPLAEVAD